MFFFLKFGTLIIPSNHIKLYFNVSNSYVIRKLRLVLFPWLHRQSRRLRAQGEWLPPRDDINSPDLYIPGIFKISVFTDGCELSFRYDQWWQLSLIFYWLPYTREFIPVSILKSDFYFYSNHTFPEPVANKVFFQILGESASRATAVVLLDFCFIKLGCYILNIQGSSQAVDIVAYGGYKFVG